MEYFFIIYDLMSDERMCSLCPMTAYSIALLGSVNIILGRGFKGVTLFCLPGARYHGVLLCKL